jgi:predicted Rdx family selenoprotein
VAAEVAGECQSQAELIKGSGGIFVVTLDGAVIYDKKATGRFPNVGEVTKLAKAARGAKQKQPSPPAK